ncbi:MAG TPA: PIG-L family deacetylase [Planctomycetota bacterium]|nr:PIG-L family deacetylase [Planctomycetota bacterium]
MLTALAIAAHPDDIEFVMSGTLLLLKEHGLEIHYLNLSTGNLGSTKMSATKTAATRRKEAQSAAKILGAHWHPPFCNDLEILYDLKSIRKLAAIVRDIKPRIILTHSPQDYMEDHTNTARLAVTAAFAHGVPNFKTTPPRPAFFEDVTIYHAMPHGLRDGLRKRIVPGAFVNTTRVHEIKLKALAAHKSQQSWLSSSQGLNSYLKTMEDMSRELGKMSRKLTFAEGWRRHSHLGFSATDSDPLRDILKNDYLVNEVYESSLDSK